MRGKNAGLQEQIALLHAILRENAPIYHILETLEKIAPPGWYVGAGAITQSIWNYQLGRPLLQGISDVDIIYFDDTDTSYEAEDAVLQNIRRALPDCALELDIKNQARVHIWYPAHFGAEVRPYTSSEDAINTWPATATCIGLRLQKGELAVYAPYGLQDAFSLIVRPNPDKERITEEIYNNKAQKWHGKWPELQIRPW